MQPRILVAGIGNIFLGDDGFGCEVVRQLQGRLQPGGVRIVDFGMRSLDLAFALLDPYDLVIFVDTASRGSSPGSVYLIEPEIDERDASTETHGMNPSTVLALARSMGARLGSVRIVGCEPASLSPTEDEDSLNAAVRAAVPVAIGMIETLILEACTSYRSH